MVIVMTSGPRTDVSVIINASQMAKALYFHTSVKIHKTGYLNKQKNKVKIQKQHDAMENLLEKDQETFWILVLRPTHLLTLMSHIISLSFIFLNQHQGALNR